MGPFKPLNTHTLSNIHRNPIELYVFHISPKYCRLIYITGGENYSLLIGNEASSHKFPRKSVHYLYS